MELLARFELATVLPRNYGFVGALNDLTIGSALRAWDEVASSCYKQKRTPIPDGIEVLLELLARFELATSSLPRMRSTG